MKTTIDFLNSTAGPRNPSSGAAQDSSVDFWRSMYTSNNQEDAISPKGLGSSRLEEEWGHVFYKSPEKKKQKTSAISFSTSLVSISTIGDSTAATTSDLSAALSAISAALSLSSTASSHSSGKQDQGKGKDQAELILEGMENLHVENISKINLSLGIQSSEGNEDDLFSSDSNGDENEIPTAFTFNASKEIKVNYQVPKMGMVFSSEQDAYIFYKDYANAVGFSIRKGKVQRLSNGAIRKRYFFCSRQGFRSNKQSNKITKYKRKETRTGCSAMIQCTVEDGRWVISQISLDHNHELDNLRHISGSCTKNSEASLTFPTESKPEMASERLKSITETEIRGHLYDVHSERNYGLYNETLKKMRKGPTDAMGEELGIGLHSSWFPTGKGNADDDRGNEEELKAETGEASSRASDDPSIWKTLEFPEEQSTFLGEIFKEHNPTELSFAFAELFKIDHKKVEVWLRIFKERAESKQKDLELLKGENQLLKKENELLKKEILEKDNESLKKYEEFLWRQNRFL